MKLKIKLRNSILIVILMLFLHQKTFSQCFEIESILVDACDTGPDEGFNEMVRFKIGNTALNTSSLSVNWPSNAWQNLIKNAITSSKVATLNAQIIAAGGCGKLIEPTGGVLPANAKVILVTSYNFDVVLNTFGAISEDIYILFQNNSTSVGGHFGNFGASATRTLSMSFGSGCSDTVTYNRSLLVDSSGNKAAGNGSTVNFSPSGAATYVNNGCLAPVDVFTVEAGTSPISHCPGTTIALLGTAQGQQSVAWSASSGTFSSPNTLATNYTIDPAANGLIMLTLKVTNSCGDKTDTVIVNVNSSSIPTFTAVGPICSGDNLSALPTTSNNSITGTWSPILDNTVTKTYTFTPNLGQCATTATMTITVNPSGTLTLFCDAANTTATNVAFDWNNVTGYKGYFYSYTINGGSAVTGYIKSPSHFDVPVSGPGISVTFTILSVDGVPCVSPVSTTCNSSCSSTIVPNFPLISPICFGSTAPILDPVSPNGISGTWSPAVINTSLSGNYIFTPNATLFPCATKQTLNATVTSKAIPTFTAVPPICSGGNLSALPTTSNNSIQGSWSPTLDNTTTKTYTFTPNAGQCATTATLTITVNPNVIPTFTAVTPICSGDNLPALPTTSNNSITGNWSPALDNTTTKTYTFTPNAGQCASSNAFMTITVNPSVKPTFTTLGSFCSGDNVSALPTTSNNSITGTWSPALDNTITKTYTFTPNSGQCASSTTMTLTVIKKTIPDFITALSLCSGSVAPTLALTSPNGITGSWFPSTIDNTETKNYVFTPNPGQCAAIATMNVEVYENEVIDSVYYLCANDVGQVIAPVTIKTNLSPLAYSFVWTLNGSLLSATSSFLVVSSVGLYNVTATSLTGGCAKVFNADVQESKMATVEATVGFDFNNQQQIIVTVNGGLGNYDYQLDYGLPQTSNVFSVSKGGEYKIKVIDNLGCNNFNLSVNVLNYPRFFTPNSDGYNDNWNIDGLLRPEKATIYIFDRYGKLLKQISPLGLGWDGTYNGKQMPSNDYWFKLLYEEIPGENKEFKAHFSLKR